MTWAWPRGLRSPLRLGRKQVNSVDPVKLQEPPGVKETTVEDITTLPVGSVSITTTSSASKSPTYTRTGTAAPLLDEFPQASLVFLSELRFVRWPEITIRQSGPEWRAAALTLGHVAKNK